MKKKITALMLTALLLVTLGGATVLAAGNGWQGDQWQETQGQADGSQGYTGTERGAKTCGTKKKRAEPSGCTRIQSGGSVWSI